MMDNNTTNLAGIPAEMQDNSNEESNQPEVDESRRKALKKLGKYAVYTPPTLLAIFSSGLCTW